MNAPDVRLILSDIDGTILPVGQKLVGARTCEAFRRAIAAGIHVGPASGRAISHVLPAFCGDRELVATALATNGMQVYLDGRLIHEEHLDHPALVRVAEVLHGRAHVGVIVFDGGTPLLVEGSRDDLRESFPTYADQALDAPCVPSFEVVKANVFVAGDLDATRLTLELLEREVPELGFNLPLPGFINLTPVGYSKASGIDVLCEALGIGLEQVVVFGDGGNDLEMLEHVPNSVAVAGAADEARSAARWHVGRCEDEAVAAAIESLACGSWPFTE